MAMDIQEEREQRGDLDFLVILVHKEKTETQATQETKGQRASKGHGAKLAFLDSLECQVTEA